MPLVNELRNLIRGDAEDDEKILERYSRDASLFVVRPQVVVFPKDVEDIKKLVRFVSSCRDQGEKISLTARAGGSDMTGGPLSESIVMDFTRYMNHLGEIKNETIWSEPGVWYRDFEKKTLKEGMLMPSYPASREICAIGGMVNNNAGGEKTLKYGKTDQYVEKMKVVLADGNEYELKKLSKSELDQKMSQNDFEGLVYRKTFELLDKNYDLAKSAKPAVSKNSMGYNIWDVWNREKGEFDLTKLFVGSQGTLGITTNTLFRLIKAKPESGLLVIFLKRLDQVAAIVNALLPLNPVSFESFDNHTFKLAVKFFWGFVKQFGKNIFYLAWSFLPEFWMLISGGVPKLVMLLEFEGDTKEEVIKQIEKASAVLSRYKVKMTVAGTKQKAKKYWLMRRESFNLLRHRVKDRKAAPFIDDMIVKPEYLPEFLPKLYNILNKYNLLYTIAGHVGNGNFHVIPLMKLKDAEDRAKIIPAMKDVNALTLSFNGSLSAEHNEGLIRGPFSKDQFGEAVYNIFKEIKNIFDPKGIFNPGKKVGVSWEYVLEHMVKD